MKTALYFDEQDAQLVLTAQSEWEKTILKMLIEHFPEHAFEGGFYDCQGGWIRQSRDYTNSGWYQRDQDYTGESLIIRMPKKKSE